MTITEQIEKAIEKKIYLVRDKDEAIEGVYSTAELAFRAAAELLSYGWYNPNVKYKKYLEDNVFLSEKEILKELDKNGCTGIENTTTMHHCNIIWHVLNRGGYYGGTV